MRRAKPSPGVMRWHAVPASGTVGGSALDRRRGLPMADSDDREDGFYWIRIDSQEAEVAQWQSEWGQWLVAGSAMPLSDAWSSRVTVLSERLSPPGMDSWQAGADAPAGAIEARPG